MSTEQNREFAHRIMGDLDRRNIDAVVDVCAPDAQFHGFAPMTLDAQGYRGAMSALMDAFPDSRFIVDDIIAEGEKVSVRHRLVGTHLNPFQDIPATGKEVTVNAIALLHLNEGTVKEIWLNADFMGMMMQLGVIPAPGQAVE